GGVTASSSSVSATARSTFSPAVSWGGRSNDAEQPASRCTFGGARRLPGAAGWARLPRRNAEWYPGGDRAPASAPLRVGLVRAWARGAGIGGVGRPARRGDLAGGRAASVVTCRA